VVTQLLPFLNALGAPGAYGGLILTLFSFSALCSVLWALWFRFSYCQFKLLSKYILLLDGGISAWFIGFSYLGFEIVFPHLFELMLESELVSSRYLATRLVGTATFLILFIPSMGLLGLLKKTVGQRISEWLRIKYIPDKMSLDQTQGLLSKAERELEHGNYEGAGQLFHSAATIYTNLGRWGDSAENYLKAADALSMEKNLAFGVACTYGFAAAASIIDNRIDEANQAIEKGKEIIKKGKMEAKTR